MPQWDSVGGTADWQGALAQTPGFNPNAPPPPMAQPQQPPMQPQPMQPQQTPGFNPNMPPMQGGGMPMDPNDPQFQMMTQRMMRGGM